MGYIEQMFDRDVAISSFPALVEREGNVGLLEKVCDRVAEGEGVREIALSYGVRPTELWGWLRHCGRMEAYESALAARADREVNEALRIADEATPETVGVARLRVETKLKVAGKWDRSRYGDGTGVGGAGIGQVTVVIGEVSRGVVVESDNATDS